LPSTSTIGAFSTGDAGLPREAESVGIMVGGVEREDGTGACQRPRAGVSRATPL